VYLNAFSFRRGLALNDKSSIMNVMNDSSRAIATSTVSFAPADRAFVQAVARRIVGSSAADVDDVTQDALLLAYRHRASFRGDSRYHTWLYRIVTTAAIAHLRRRRRSRLEPIDAVAQRAIDELADPAPAADDAVADAEVRDRVARALVELTPAYREILTARLDASAEEVARRLGISVTNVKVRAHRARRQLKEKLAGFESMAA
jgi:RNA polymerase sigma-70 factor (ECF subfamily)